MSVCYNVGMKKIIALFLGIMLISGSSVSSAQTSPEPSIIITEIAAHEAAEAEWIEIYNRSESALDLSDWKFFEDETNHGLAVFQGNAIIQPQEFAIIANRAEIFHEAHPEFLGTIFDSSWGSLKEEGELVGLKNDAAALVESFIYPAFTEEKTLERLDMNGTLAPTWSHAATPPLLANLPDDVGSSTPQNQPEPDAISEAPNPASNPDTIPTVPTAPPPQISTPNIQPVALISVQSGELVTHDRTTINFDGRASYDPDGTSLTYYWDMGDGTIETTANPGPHAYTAPGTYVVVLTVVDGQGGQHTAQQVVQVLKKASTAAGAPPALPPAPPPAPVSNIAAPTQSNPMPMLPSLLAPAELQLQGYFVFVPYQTELAKPTVAKSKAKPAKKAVAKAAPKKVAKKPSAKIEVRVENGDFSEYIRITEVFPAPSTDTDAEEWIELFNAGTMPVNLGNWGLSDASTKAPSRIGNDVMLAPDEFRVFPKSETKISLNNDRDSVILTDFAGNIIDQMMYSEVQKGASYALISIIEDSVDENSVAQVAGADAISEVWEWTLSKTPGRANPSFEKISGEVHGEATSNESGELELPLTLTDGEDEMLSISEETLDPVVAQAVLRQGARIQAYASRNADGRLALKNMIRVEPPEPKQEKSSIFFWTIIISIVLGGATLVFKRRMIGRYLRQLLISVEGR